MDIIIIGSASKDIIIETDYFPKPGEETFCKSYTEVGGGAGANVAVLLSSVFKIDTYLMCSIGSDLIGEDLFKKISASNIKTDYIRTALNSKNTQHIIAVDDYGNRITYVSSGSMSNFSLSLYDNNIFNKHKNIYLAPTRPETAMELYHFLKNNKTSLFFNPGSSFFKDNSSFLSMLEVTKMLIVNELEAKNYSNQTDIKKAANFFLNKSVKSVAITLGEKGSYYCSESENIYLPGFKVKTKSTIGCGDAFSAGFVGAILSGLSPSDSLKYGNAIGAFVASQFGMREKLPLVEDIHKIFKTEVFSVNNLNL